MFKAVQETYAGTMDPARPACLTAWEAYVETRPYLGATPAEACAGRLLRNAGPIKADAIRKGGADCETADDALREVVAALLDGEMGKLSDEGAKLARFLDNRICVPRDMGCLPVQGLRALAKNQRGG